MNNPDTTPGRRPATPPRPARDRDVFLVCDSENELGGVGTWTHRMAGLLARRGHRVRVVGIGPPRVAVTRPVDPAYRVETLNRERPDDPWQPRGPVAGLDLRARRGEARRVAERRAATARLGLMFRRALPGAVVVVTQTGAMEWVTEAGTAGLRVIGMSHQSFAGTRSPQLVQQAYCGVDRLVAPTQQDADAWAGRGAAAVSALPGPLPLEPGHPAPRTARAVVALGRLSHEKGHDILLDAWAQVAPRAPGWRLRIHGDGDEREALRAGRDELGLRESVDLAGATDDVASALRAGSLLVQPSRAEGFPLSLLEAMANGIPCLAFDCAPGVREIIEDGVDGLLVQTGDVDAFARALHRLIEDRELRDRLGDRAFHSIRRFAPEAIVERWEQLFDFLHR